MLNLWPVGHVARHQHASLIGASILHQNHGLARHVDLDESWPSMHTCMYIRCVTW